MVEKDPRGSRGGASRCGPGLSWRGDPVWEMPTVVMRGGWDGPTADASCLDASGI